jgi:hypothetical protein
MLCPKCDREMFIDRVDPVTGKYYYVCVNLKCENKGKAFALTGEEVEAMITMKGETRNE